MHVYFKNVIKYEKLIICLTIMTHEPISLLGPKIWSK